MNSVICANQGIERENDCVYDEDSTCSSQNWSFSDFVHTKAASDESVDLSFAPIAEFSDDMSMEEEFSRSQQYIRCFELDLATILGASSSSLSELQGSFYSTSVVSVFQIGISAGAQAFSIVAQGDELAEEVFDPLSFSFTLNALDGAAPLTIEGGGEGIAQLPVMNLYAAMEEESSLGLEAREEELESELDDTPMPNFGLKRAEGTPHSSSRPMPAIAMDARVSGILLGRGGASSIVPISTARSTASSESYVLPTASSVDLGTSSALVSEAQGYSLAASTASRAATSSSLGSAAASSSSSSGGGGGGGGGGGSGRGGGSASVQTYTDTSSESDTAPESDARTYTTDVYYKVLGDTKIGASDYLRFDTSVIAAITGNANSEFHLHVQGETLGGESPILDGGGIYRGFEILFKTYSAADVNIALTGVEALTNFSVSSTKDVAGAALCLSNGGEIIFHNTEVGDRVEFSNNTVISTGGHASGGAIYLTGGASVGDISADFINNSAFSTDDSTITHYSRGGAIAIGITDSDNLLMSKNDKGGIDYFGPNTTQVSSVGNIYGKFEENSSSFGGAIYTGAKASVGHVEADFIGNLAQGEKEQHHTSGAEGGGIRTYQGTFGSIKGDFTENVAHALSGNAIGGAVSLNATDVQGGITGHFDGNIAAVDDASASAHGGAYSLKNQTGEKETGAKDIIFRDSSFTNNVASTTSSSSSKIYGGAFYIENSQDVSFIADQENVVFSGNYVTTKSSWSADDGLVSESDAIRISSGIYAVDSSVTLQTTAGSDKTITFHDGVYGVSTEADPSKLIVNGYGSAEYDVYFNDYIAFDELIIEDGGVELGRHTHTYNVQEKNEAGEIVDVVYEVESQGSFVFDANVTVNEGGVLKAHASSFDGVGEIDLNGTTDLAGTLKLTGGTLKTDIGKSGVTREGHIDLIGDTTTIASGFQVYADTLDVGATLIIEAPHTVESLMNDTFVSVETILFSGYSKNDINNGGKQIVMQTDAKLRLHELTLEVGTVAVDDIFELIVSSTPDIVDSIDVILENFTASVFSMSGEELVQNEDYVIEYRTDGGVQIRMLIDIPPIPEPSSSMLILIALSSALARRRRKKSLPLPRI